MLFCSLPFTFFFLIVLAGYWAMPWHKPRVYLLLAASFYFYACWNHWLALLLCGSTMGDYLLARGMEQATKPRMRKLLLLGSLGGNLGLLCYFKYANFFLRSLEQATAGTGLAVSLPVLQVILPIGISFYTFEAINYTVDVYRGTIRAERDLAHFMLFILFFPHLVAGPIVRARAFLPQVGRRKHWSWLRAHAGCQLILLGLVKKLAVADRMALYADPVFADPARFASFALWMAAIAYAIQVYCDFSGYTDMALGLAHLLGYHLCPNFNLPFAAANLADFWRRWHISLTGWIRDYLFIPLGGSRGSRWQTSRNTLLAFTLCGLWHGANWNFVALGVSQRSPAACCTPHFSLGADRRPALERALRSLPGTMLRVTATFACFCLTLAVFRTPGLAAAGVMLRGMVLPVAGAGLTLQLQGLLLTFALVILAHILALQERWARLLESVPGPLRGLGFGTALVLVLVLAPGSSKAFIYFQF